MNARVDKYASQGKQAFESNNFDRAVDFFLQALKELESQDMLIDAAEMKNNLSVAFLKAGKPQEAYDAALGTDEVFAREEDALRQAIALGNQAAALEALGKIELAISKYEQSADLFSEVGDGEKRSLVLQSAAALKLRRGKIMDSALSMIGSVESSPKPNLLQRILKFFLRIKA